MCASASSKLLILSLLVLFGFIGAAVVSATTSDHEVPSTFARGPAVTEAPVNTEEEAVKSWGQRVMNIFHT
uniref:Transmembrane protein n=1 Tax=Panagrellus redivivus TaxID=6233 RepID=A0A7E4W6P7_PANRE